MVVCPLFVIPNEVKDLARPCARQKRRTRRRVGMAPVRALQRTVWIGTN